MDFGNKVYYPCFCSHSLDQAIRNCLFACFSGVVWEDLRKIDSVEDRYQFLLSRFGDKIQESTREMNELYGDAE